MSRSTSKESRHFTEGGKGSQELAREVMKSVSRNKPWTPLYNLDDSLYEKVHKVCRDMYGANDVAFSKEAEQDLSKVLSHGDQFTCKAAGPGGLVDDHTAAGFLD